MLVGLCDLAFVCCQSNVFQLQNYFNFPLNSTRLFIKLLLYHASRYIHFVIIWIGHSRSLVCSCLNYGLNMYLSCLSFISSFVSLSAIDCVISSQTGIPLSDNLRYITWHSTKIQTELFTANYPITQRLYDSVSFLYVHNGLRIESVT